MCTFYLLQVFMNACFYIILEFDNTLHVLQCPINSVAADHIRLQPLGLGLVGDLFLLVSVTFRFSQLVSS